VTLQPHDPEGGALLWSVEGTLTVRKTPAGYHVLALADGEEQVRFDVQQDDMEAFLEQLSILVRGY